MQAERDEKAQRTLGLLVSFGHNIIGVNDHLERPCGHAPPNYDIISKLR